MSDMFPFLVWEINVLKDKLFKIVSGWNSSKDV